MLNVRHLSLVTIPLTPLVGKRAAKSRGSSKVKTVFPGLRNRVNNEKASTAGHSGGSGTKSEYQTELWRVFCSAVGFQKLDCSELGQVVKICSLSITEGQSLISQFEKWAESRLTMGSPNSDRVLVFVKINVFRALISNSKHLGFNYENMPDDALSPFSNSSNHCHHKTLPPALRPTKVQCEIPHHPWLDLIPIPGMRDNLIRAGDSYDDMQLCGDLVGCFSASSNREGMIVWGEPWDPNAWEVTEPLLRHWGWTIRGCSELLASTNFWRERRGEKPLQYASE